MCDLNYDQCASNMIDSVVISQRTNPDHRRDIERVLHGRIGALADLGLIESINDGYEALALVTGGYPADRESQELWRKKATLALRFRLGWADGSYIGKHRPEAVNG